MLQTQRHSGLVQRSISEYYEELRHFTTLEKYNTFKGFFDESVILSYTVTTIWRP